MKKWENPKLTNLAVSNTSTIEPRAFSGWVICKGEERHCFWTSSIDNPELKCKCGADIETYCGPACVS